MAILSMTGFARSSGRTAGFQWAWQIKSVNGRGLDIRCRMPGQMDEIEPKVRKKISRALSRGSISVALDLRHEGGDQDIRINEKTLALYRKIAEEISSKDGVRGARADGLLNLRGVIEVSDFSLDEEEKRTLVTALLAGLDEALAALNRMRTAEGDALQKTLISMLDEIAGLVDQAKLCAALQPEQLRSRFSHKIQELLAGSADFETGRLEQEAAVLAVKADVREEVDRLSAHIQAARDLFTGHGAAGRKLDFLFQEFQRETNTICSKSTDIELTKIGLGLKAVIDQVREQAQNIE